jgi:LuxR family transcriptional regulator, positive regulator of biofilm formation
MSSKVKKKANMPLSDRAIWIIGPRKLQNELLARLLEQKTGAGCMTGDASPLKNELEKMKQIPDSVLLLLDYLEQGPDNRLDPIESDDSRPYLVALFNVTPGVGIEDMGLREGVRGFFYEKDPPETFVKGVRAIFSGELWVSRETMTKRILEDKRGPKVHPRIPAPLTAREAEILSLIASGATNKEISEKLFISSNTVKTHVYNIFHKINVPNRLQAALWAVKHL